MSGPSPFVRIDLTPEQAEWLDAAADRGIGVWGVRAEDALPAFQALRILQDAIRRADRSAVSPVRRVVDELRRDEAASASGTEYGQGWHEALDAIEKRLGL